MNSIINDSQNRLSLIGTTLGSIPNPMMNP